MRADNSTLLAAAARRRSALARERAEQTLAALAETGEPITIAGFAARAGVSRAWIYAQPGLREQIDELRGRSQQPSPPTRSENASDASLRTRLQLTLQRTRDLEAENRLLNDQVARLYGDLRHTKITPPVADTVHDTDNLIRLPQQPSDPR